MAKPSRPWLALLVSVLVHVAAALVLAGQAGRASQHGGAGAGMDAVPRVPPSPPSPPSLFVRLLPLGAPPAPSAAPQAAAMPAAVVAEPVSTPAEPPAAERHASKAAGPGAAERHYFGSEAMTQTPRVATGMVAGKILVVPGITPQTVQLQVWVSEEGTVDRVALQSPMQEEEERMLLAAFGGVKFHPGRIGRIAVRGHVAMEVMLDYAIRM